MLLMLYNNNNNIIIIMVINEVAWTHSHFRIKKCVLWSDHHTFVVPMRVNKLCGGVAIAVTYGTL